MDLGTVMSVAQTLFAALQCSQLRELCNLLGYKSELENLECTVNAVKAVLLDAESREVHADLSHQAQLYIDQLKDALYDADDLLDEFVTLAEQKKHITSGGTVSKKVRLLFSRFNSLAVAHKMSQGVQEIRKKLDAIAINHNKFGFKLDCEPTRRRREETCSYVYTHEIIGREAEVKTVVGRLVDPSVQQHVSCLTIVGIGGLGKTAFAQLVYNDPRITGTFSLKMWTCVSDQDLKHLDVKATICKILHSSTGQNHEHLAMESLQKELQNKLAGNKYLLVLDDVWNEDRLQWLKLMKFLMSGSEGSWILVTTRSEKTATSVGDDAHLYKLKGLSEENSWRLFQMMAFGQREDQLQSPDLIKIGRVIVKRCANVPLAIRVVGSLLYGQGKEKWLLLQEMGFGGLKQGGEYEGIQSILKFSYHNLQSPLKACFIYCAIFPKDHVIDKEMLINLWMSQDYIVCREGQSIEDVGDDYFLILANRCFFQDMRKDEFGKIISCKIHDLMHDLAQGIAGKEVYSYTAGSALMSLDKRTRHLYGSSRGNSGKVYVPSKIRTFLQASTTGRCISVDMVARNWMCLRTLDLHFLGIDSLPSTIGELLHLRYFDLSCNFGLKLLPNSISKLHNLQTLILFKCSAFMKFPKDLSRFVNLRILDTEYCESLNTMPWGMGKLKCLHKLGMCVAGHGDSTLKQDVDMMEGLKALTNLKGSLTIKILGNLKYSRRNFHEGGYLKNKEHLNCVTIMFPDDWEHRMEKHEEQVLLEHLQPHRNIKELNLYGYKGLRVPSWAHEDDMGTFLLSLVKLSLKGYDGWKHLPSLRKLHNLRSLILEDTSRSSLMGGPAGYSEAELLIPSLEKLELRNLPKLKGWWRDDDINACDSLLKPFPWLSKLSIWVCPNLTSVLTCSGLEELKLSGKFSEKVRIMLPTESMDSKLRRVEQGSVGSVKSAVAMEALQWLHEIKITGDSEIESLSEEDELFYTCSSSLRLLQIIQCKKLKRLNGGLEHLTNLETLHLSDLSSLSLSIEDEGVRDEGMPWRCLARSLRYLTLSTLPSVVKLPKGMRYLTSLQTLYICDCLKLESVPEWMPELASLRNLGIQGCSNDLWERCKGPTGEDWPNIHHIPTINLIYSPFDRIEVRNEEAGTRVLQTTPISSRELKIIRLYLLTSKSSRDYDPTSVLDFE